MSLPRAEVLRSLDSDLRRLIDGRHHDPHSLLGARRHGDALIVIALLPHAEQVMVQSQAPGEPWLDMTRLPLSDVFIWSGNAAAISGHHRLRWRDPAGALRERFDAYSFAPLIDDAALERFSDGHDATAGQLLGAHVRIVDGIDGVQFAVWAPNAERVSVVGPFCQWDGRSLPMRSRGASGIWELFIPGLSGGDIYKFEIRGRARGEIFLKSDPFATASELRPATASRVAPQSLHVWRDSDWLQARRTANPLRSPVSIYEAHLGSWRRGPHGEFLNYRELAAQLVPYLQQLGFTYVELLPITEHPLDDSWGYQTTGYFAPTSRHGSPDDLKFLIDACHQADIGVLLDWVPAHFPRDAHGLANFDGSALYEYPDPQRAEHKDWGTLIFNYERKEVRSFLL